ncbi:MAG: glutamate synthase, partial [Oscillospiraceae bacterium]|nr:glutamate synthase [Oscillospiraceae bacterium]
MLSINAEGLEHKELNEQIRAVQEPCVIESCRGQRFIAAGMSDKELYVRGVPGNALGAYLNGGIITVQGSAQDAVGDTMNAGTIVVHGNIGDAAGYAMRGGKIYIRGNAGYRAGIHMKAYQEKVPLMIIGGKAGSFLGEYQAGGVIIVLNLDAPGEKCVGFFPCTGMHGGKMFLRSKCRDVVFPEQVTLR